MRTMGHPECQHITTCLCVLVTGEKDCGLVACDGGLSSLPVYGMCAVLVQAKPDKSPSCTFACHMLSTEMMTKACTLG